MSEPLHPGSSSDPGSPDLSTSADSAREQLRQEFDQLRAEIGDLGGDESVAGAPIGSGFGRVRASLAVLALSAAVAAAAANFALQGGRPSKIGNVSEAPPSPEPGSGAVTAGGPVPHGSLPALQHDSFPALALIAGPLRTDGLGSSGGLGGDLGIPSGGPSSVLVVGKPEPVGGHGSRGENVTGAHAVSGKHSPAPHSPPAPHAPPAPAPAAPESLAYEPPPPAPSGGGNPGGGGGGGGEGPGHGPGHEKPGGGGSTAAATGAPGNGLGKGHIKAIGNGHDGGSPGRGHEKDQGGGEVASTTGGKSHPAPAPPPAPPAEPAAPAPGQNGNHGRSGEEHGKGLGKAGAPGQVGK